MTPNQRQALRNDVMALPESGIATLMLALIETVPEQVHAALTLISAPPVIRGGLCGPGSCTCGARVDHDGGVHPAEVVHAHASTVAPVGAL